MEATVHRIAHVDAYLQLYVEELEWCRLIPLFDRSQISQLGCPENVALNSTASGIDINSCILVNPSGEPITKNLPGQVSH